MWEALHERRRLRNRLIIAQACCKELECRDKAIARGIVIEEDHVAALFATNNGVDLAHLVQNVLVPHLGLHDRNARSIHRFGKAKVTHDCRNYHIIAQKTAFLQIECTNGLDHIAVDLVTQFIDEHNTIRIAIMRDANVGTRFCQ